MSEEKKKPTLPTPAWAWLFVVACVLIPILTLGGAIPGAIGGGGAFGCFAVAKDPSKQAGTRVLICVGITAVCWAIFLIFLGGMVALGARLAS